jgi:hypothetical protein
MYRGAMPFKPIQLVELFVARGIDDGVGHTIATVTNAATEGVVFLSNAEQSRAPLDEAASTLTELIRGKT